MSSENETNATQDASGGGGAEDLANALSAGETEFVATEEKKPVVSQGMLYLLLLIAVGGGGTYLMYKRSGPDTAAAATSAESAKAQQTIDTFLTSGPSGIKMMEEMLRNTEKVVQQFLEYPSVTQVPLSDLHTNPFRLASKKDEAKVDEDESKKVRTAERQAAVRASQELNLQSIIHSGKTRACMINNAMYTEGQQVEQFTVEKISPSSVIVKTGVYRFELKMQK